MKDDNNKIKNLDIEISKAQIENFINNPESVMTETEIKEGKKSTIKKVLVITAILLLSGIMVIFPNPITLTVFLTSFLGTGLALNIKDSNKTIERIKNPPEAIIFERILTKTSKDFEKNKSPEKTKEVFSTPTITTTKSYLTENNFNYLTKEETLTKINEEINMYYMNYTLPPLNIKQEELNSYFDIVYTFFQKNKIESNFYIAMSELNRFILSKSLVNKTPEITITDFIENTYYLQSGFNSTKLNINKKEILKLTKELLATFKDYSKKTNKTK